MSYLAACLIVLAAAATAGGASFLLRAVVGKERSQHREFGGQVFQQVGIMFSVLLSFVFSEVWSEYNIAAQAVSRECAALHGAAMLAGTLPESRGEAVSKEILVYAHTVTEIEWPAMTRLRNSPDASTAFHILFDRAAKISAPGAGDLAIRSQIVSLLAYQLELVVL